MKIQVLKYLETDARFRERKNKNKGIANLIREKYPSVFIPDYVRNDLIADVLEADRMWRWWLNPNDGGRVDLQGSDYKKKDQLEQEKEQELGYEVGYNEDIKLQKKLI